VIVLRLRLVFFVRGIDLTSRSAKGYSSGMLVASWRQHLIDSCGTQVVGLATCYAS
jgi:hypothetical protein